MLRLTGILLVSVSLGAAGFVCSAAQMRRLRATEDALHAVELLQGQILRLLQPLAQAVDALAPQNPLLQRLSQTRCILRGEALRTELSHAGLGHAQIDALQRLFQAIPQLSSGQNAPFEAVREQLSLQLALQKKAVDRGAALYPKLGLLAGLAAFLILI